MHKRWFPSKKRKALLLKRFDPEYQREMERLFPRLLAFLVFIFLVMTLRLFVLQVLEYPKYKAASENNMFRAIRIPPPRGSILDRTGRLLATARPSFNLLFYRDARLKKQREVLAMVANLTKKSLPWLQARLTKANEKGLPMYMPVVLEQDLDWETVSRLEVHLHSLPGVDIEVVPLRRYPGGPIAPHLIGYIDEVSLEDLKKKRFRNVRPGDLVGKSGIELMHEEELRGIAGVRHVEIDAKGRLVRILGTTPPQPGKDIYLTLDRSIQAAAEEAMAGKVGAVVALEPSSGRVLCLLSSPGFDPTLFVRGLTEKQWKMLNDRMKRPLVNRAIQGTYPPGSIFKIIMALGALQEGLITPDTTFYCPGYFRLGRHTFRCWYWQGHKETNLYKAIVESCDVYFYQVGLKMGIDTIARYARAFGLGERTGINLPDERSGIVPTRQWKMRVYKEPWQKGETLITSIGQGFLTITPLQAASITSTVANGGIIYRPAYVDEVRDSNGRVERRFVPVSRGKIPIKKRYLDFLKKALLGVVDEKKGTGHACRIPGLSIAGKTGTSQVVKQKRRRESEKLSWRFRDHAWFVAFAPVEDPKIAVAVLVEHGGYGGKVAAPIARKVIEAWLNTRQPGPPAVSSRHI